jgi:hypothetical protein
MDELLTKVAAAVDALPEGDTTATFNNGDGSFNVRELFGGLRAVEEYNPVTATSQEWEDKLFHILDLDQVGKAMLSVVQEKPGMDFTVGNQTFSLAGVARSILRFVAVNALK